MHSTNPNRQAEGLMQLARLLLDAVARDDEHERNAAQLLGTNQAQKEELIPFSLIFIKC